MKDMSIKSSGMKEYKKWSKSVSKDDLTKEIRVEEIENGFLICINEYGDYNGEYKDSSKKYYSDKNPLGDKYLKADESINGAIDDFLKDM